MILIGQIAGIAGVFLYGRFKNESNVPRYHVMNVVRKSKSGIEIDS